LRVEKRCQFQKNNMADLKKIKKLREDTGASIALCNKALAETDNLEKAKLLLKKWGIELAAKKSDRATNNGIISSYVHHNGKMAAMVSVLCETDFVANNSEFKKLAHEIAMQIASMKPKTTNELLKQQYIRDQSLTIESYIKQNIALLGENIQIGEFVRLEL
jgi:elongation factor Ts